MSEAVALTPSPVLNIEAVAPADACDAQAADDGYRPTALEERLDAETNGRVGAAAGLKFITPDPGEAQPEGSGSRALVAHGSSHGAELSRERHSGRLQWRGMDVCDEFRSYADQVASGADLPPYRGPILKDPGFPWHDQLNPGAPKPRSSNRAVVLAALIGSVALAVSAIVGSDDAARLSDGQTIIGSLQAAISDPTLPEAASRAAKSTPTAPLASSLPPLSLPDTDEQSRASAPVREEQPSSSPAEFSAQEHLRQQMAQSQVTQHDTDAVQEANATPATAATTPAETVRVPDSTSPSRGLPAIAKREAANASTRAVAAFSMRSQEPEAPSQPVEDQLAPPPSPPTASASQSGPPKTEPGQSVEPAAHPELAPPPAWAELDGPAPTPSRAQPPSQSSRKEAPSLLVEEPSF